MCVCDYSLVLSLSSGRAEQGQLGQVAQRYSYDGDRNGISHLLQPAPVMHLPTSNNGYLAIHNV